METTGSAGSLSATPGAEALRDPVRVPANRVPLRLVRTRSRGTSQGRIDTFFRRPDTWLARGLTKVSPHRGTGYSSSTAKRMLDVAVTIPLALIVILLVALLVLVNKLLYPRHPALFLQDRVGRGGDLRVIKIRSLMTGSSWDGAGKGVTVCTAFGRLIRQHYLDELPQLLQVLAGQLSLVGTRVLPRKVYDGLKIAWSVERFQTWQAMYGSTPLGLTGVHQVLRGTGKQDARRFHRDMFYARHASLGFDLYLLWRTFGTTDNGLGHATRLTPQKQRKSYAY